MIVPKGFCFWILLLLFSFNVVNAATLITFDDPYLSMVHDGDRLNGYYRLSLPDTGIRGPVSCEFFITAFFQNTNKIQFSTYMTDTRFLNRFTQMDLPGDLYIDGGRWEFPMDRQQGGCDTAAGGDFRRESAGAYTVTKIMPVIGIFTIKTKINFFPNKIRCFE